MIQKGSSSINNNVKYPVLVWIHGGSFLAGSADTGIDKEVVIKNLVSKDIIVVTLNYRLGPLGKKYISVKFYYNHVIV